MRKSRFTVPRVSSENTSLVTPSPCVAVGAFLRRRQLEFALVGTFRDRAKERGPGTRGGGVSLGL